jgi:hypothetical protein
VHGGSQVVAQVADPFLEGQRPLPQAVGRLEGWSTGNGPKELALAQEGEETGGIFCIGFTRPVLPRFALVPHGVAMPQADRSPARRDRTVPGRSGYAGPRCCP